MTTQASIAILDYGMGNLHSVASALAKVAPNHRILITHEPAEIAEAERVVFPGVGAIRDCMTEMRARGFEAALKSTLAAGTPILAICVGLQALMQHSEENGGVDCLALLPGKVRGFAQTPAFCSQQPPLKVPHMGWNQVWHSQDHPLWQGIRDGGRFYFVHSYYVETPTPELLAGRCDYGLPFAAALAHQNLFAVQFHPEKSHDNGLQLLRNFVHWTPA